MEKNKLKQSTEEKELLLKDLCARLPYGVKVQYKGNQYDLTEMHKDGRTYLGSHNSIYGDWHCSLEFEDYPKPYLRPMSSMTEEERKEIENIFLQDTQEIFKDPIEIRASSFYDADALDWYLKKHFDYRKLIEKGLALEAPEGMYK